MGLFLASTMSVVSLPMAQLSQSIFIILPYGAFVKQGRFLAFFFPHTKTDLPEGKPADFAGDFYLTIHFQEGSSNRFLL